MLEAPGPLVGASSKDTADKDRQRRRGTVGQVRFVEKERHHCRLAQAALPKWITGSPHVVRNQFVRSAF